jgi:rubredoxin
MWPCKNCGHENDEELSVCEECGALRFDEIGDSGDNQDSEDLFFDDECL